MKSSWDFNPHFLSYNLGLLSPGGESVAVRKKRKLRDWMEEGNQLSGSEEMSI